MYRQDSTDRLRFAHESENQTDHYTLIGKVLRLPDGSRVLLLGVEDTPRGRWLNLRPGGWTPVADLVGL